MSKLQILINAVDAKFATIEPKKVKEAEKSLTLSVAEFANFQTLKSLAQIKGIISLEDSLLIYNALGNWDKQTVGTKFVLIKLYADLLKAKMQGKL
jgi:hypothetical protein